MPSRNTNNGAKHQVLKLIGAIAKYVEQMG